MTKVTSLDQQQSMISLMEAHGERCYRGPDRDFYSGWTDRQQEGTFRNEDTGEIIGASLSNP